MSTLHSEATVMGGGKRKRQKALLPGSNPGLWLELPVSGRHLDAQAVYTARHTPPIPDLEGTMKSLYRPVELGHDAAGGNLVFSRLCSVCRLVL